MRPTGMFVMAAAIASSTALGSPARAENEFDLSVAKGLVTVTTHGGWHINKDYPWKLVVGDTKLDKSRFTLAETTATLSGAPKGAGKLKGAVCSADQCHTFEKDITIQ